MEYVTKVVIGFSLLNSVLFIVFLIERHYPPQLMSIHIASILFLWFMVLRKTTTILPLRNKWKDVLSIIFLTTLSLWVGLYRIEEITPGMYGDEVEVAKHALSLATLNDWPPFLGQYSHPTPILYLTEWSLSWLGHTKTAIRLPSVAFAALAVIAFYLLLRQFFTRRFAFLGSLLLIFQYTFVILERLAYEPPASLFWQIVAILFLTLYHKTKDKLYLVGIGLSIGGGMYTYLNFRPFAIIILIITSFLVAKSKKEIWSNELLVGLTSFIAAMPLWSFILIDFNGFWLRTTEISIFSRNYTTIEFFKELAGNIYRTSLIPFIGDPNPDKNPSGVTLFDPITMLLFLIGCIYLFKKKRSMFWVSLVLMLPPFISDIFSTEVIPEFHYYGLGHPNALRVSGFIGIILFVACYGISWIYGLLRNVDYKTMILTFGVLAICYWNWMLYFNQADIHPTFFTYNYRVNHEDAHQMAAYINTLPNKKVQISSSFSAVYPLEFFVSPEKQIAGFQIQSSESARRLIEQNEVTVVDINEHTLPILNEITTNNEDLANYDIKIISDPLQFPRIAVFKKRDL